MDVLVVVGTFDDNGGKPSKIATEIVAPIVAKSESATVFNGGNYSELTSLLSIVKCFDVIIWFADVPNDKPKIIDEIKKRNPHCILVTSKRNVDGKYGIQDLIQRCLKTHSHLLVEFQRNSDNGLYQARVLDALGNSYYSFDTNMQNVGITIRERIKQLQQFKRIGCVKVGEALPIPLDEDFLEVIHQHSLQFHQKIYGDVPIDRFLGNAAFRCPKGFPSFKGEDDLIYVTRRNIDKSMLNKDGFVAVNANSGLVNIPSYLTLDDDDSSKKLVEYYGEYKPSVDTPIQLGLYRYYNRAKYIIHSHVYVDFCKTEQNETTNSTRGYTVSQFEYHKMVIPCGAIEELYKIFYAYPSREDCNFAVNLNGHGFIVIADNLDYLKQIVYKSRDFPEQQKI